MPEYYEIKIKGHLDSRWLEGFAGMKLTHLQGNGTLLCGLLPDQPALHGLLERIRDLNLTLISVSCGDPSTHNSDKERRTDMAKKVLNHNLSEPLGSVMSARVDINVADGNLTIDRLTGGEPLLASGTLQYLQGQGQPIRSVNTSNGHATLTLKGGSSGWPGFRLPWAACNGATEWQIHLNPAVLSQITVQSGGGNVKLNLAGMMVTSLSANTGGGNVDVVLPEGAANLSITAKTGAGNVVVGIPSGLAARIHASTGLGKAIIDSEFSQIDSNTYQSPDYDSAADKVEITVNSGVGNVIVNTK